MLVVVSDLHLTDGTTAGALSAESFQMFAQQLRQVASAAALRSSRGYLPLEQLDVVLLGDTLDLMRSARWLQSSDRPWDDPHSETYFQTVARITLDVLRHNDAAIAELRRLATEGLRVPTSLTGEGETRVAVRLHYLVGDHDWPLHLPGPAYERLREAVTRGLGLANSAREPFPHDPAEQESLLQLMRSHGVLARHGDIYDPLCFEDHRDRGSLSDVIAIEIFARFLNWTQSELPGAIPARFAGQLAEIDALRPPLLAPVYIDSLLEQLVGKPSMAQRIRQQWDQLVDDFLSLPYVRSRSGWSPVDLVDGLARVLKFSRRPSSRWAEATMNWLQGARGQLDSSYYRHALAERELRSRQVRHVVYGHTHAADMRPLEVVHGAVEATEQMYFNTGSWQRSYRRTGMPLERNDFVGSDQLSLLAFYRDGERGGRSYEAWSTSWGPTAQQAVRQLRFDGPHTRGLAAPHTPQRQLWPSSFPRP